jgi:TonB family protein
MTLLLDETIKIAAVLAVVLWAARLLRDRSAAVRHWVLAAGILCATVSPAVAVAVPWTFNLKAITDNRAEAPTVTTEIVAPAVTRAASTPQKPSRDAASSIARVDVRLLVPTLWLCGAAGVAVLTIVGFLRLAWLSSHARPLASGSWAAMANEIAGARGLKRRVSLLQSDRATLLVTWGFLHPRILLPAGAEAWSEERIRIVLEHEIAHIQRGDWLVFMAAELLRALHWFNPLVWIACARMRQESERACDDAVLVAGVRGHDYATHLLELARLLNARRPAMSPWAAPAMARMSSLQGRISVMLNANIDRRPLTSSFRLASTIAVLALTVLIAGLRAQTFVTLSGSVVDPTNRAMADTRLVLTSPDGRTKHEVRSDASGHYVFAGITPGEYTLDVLSPGFAEVHEPITIGSRNVDRNISLKVGLLRETIMVTGAAGGSSGGTRTTLGPEERKRVEQKQLATVAACTANQSAAGGNIVPPLKLTSVQPQYPGGDGVVLLDATIGTDGNVQNVAVTSPPNVDLDNAAAAAVREWQFTPTLLNCAPTEVHMKVTIAFKQTK